MIDSKNIPTCLIGFGNAGQGEYLREKIGNSHFDSIRNNAQLKLLGVVDPRFAGVQLQHNNIFISPNIRSLEKNIFDLVVIATSTTSHQEVCREVSEILKPRAILIEKPVGSSLKEFNEIKNYLENVPTVCVNYQRNYDPKIIQQFTDTVRLGYSKGVVYYSNGAINNASHGLALLISVLGSPTNTFRASNATKDHPSEINLDFVVEFGETRIFFIATEEKNYSMFRIELFGPKGSWIYDAGLERSEMRVRIEDPIYVGRFSLTENSTITSIPDTESFTHVYNYLEKRVRGESDVEPNLGAGLDLAYEVHQVIEKAQK
jgi:predicted dehydrogenase